MHQDLIQNFLVLPDVVGIALMQGRIIPYFYVKEKIIDAEQKIELIRHFRKSILDIPTLSNCLEFQIDSYFGYTYKLNDILTLLVIVSQHSIAVKSMANNILLSALKSDLNTTVKLFEGLTRKVFQPVKIDATPVDKITTDHLISIDESLKEDYTIEDLVTTLNALSQIVCSYLGPKITSNFWQLTRPKQEWLNSFNIKSTATIEFVGSTTDLVSPLQHLFIREWTNQFINQCSHIIRDLPSRIDQKLLDQKHRRMISIVPKGYLNEVENLSYQSSSLFD
jgi:hypothetical protein